jgi:succinate dehydrogenase/fumarate reductase flavoprotein subunit
LTVARCIGKAASLRHESRGVHHRHDYPQMDDKRFKKHIQLTISD